jgi:hypothetical protein
MDCLKDCKIPGIYVTGGLSSACLISTDFEYKKWYDSMANKLSMEFKATGSYKHPSMKVKENIFPDNDLPYGIARSPVGYNNMLEWLMTGDMRDKRNLFLSIVEERYGDADLDIAIFANDEKEFQGKLAALEKHINEHVVRTPEGKISYLRHPVTRQLIPVTVEPKETKEPKEHLGFQHHKADRYRLKLPNERQLEAFFMNTKEKENKTPLAMVFNFHVPPVRHYYDLAADDVFILPSCLWAGWTLLCLDIKYFASSTDPREILAKYWDRGYTFVLNKYEQNLFQGTISPLEEVYRVSYNRRRIRNDAFIKFRDRRYAKGKAPRVVYAPRKLWETKVTTGGISTYVIPFEYPRNVFKTPTQLQISEGPILEQKEENPRTWEIPFELIKGKSKTTGAFPPQYALPAVAVGYIQPTFQQTAGGAIPTGNYVQPITPTYLSSII